MEIDTNMTVAKPVAKGGKGGKGYLKPAEMRSGNPCGKGGKGYLKPAEMRGKAGGNTPPILRIGFASASPRLARGLRCSPKAERVEVSA